MDGPLVVRFLIETSIIIRGMILYLEINVQAVDTSYFVMALGASINYVESKSAILIPKPCRLFY